MAYHSDHLSLLVSTKGGRWCVLVSVNVERSGKSAQMAGVVQDAGARQYALGFPRVRKVGRVSAREDARPTSEGLTNHFSILDTLSTSIY